MELIDGNLISRQIIEELTDEVSNLVGIKPSVTFVRVGEDPASVSYVNKKGKVAARIGIESNLMVFPEIITQEELINEITTLNEDPSVHGILVQAPLPSHIDERVVFNHVLPTKDVDGFNAANLGRLCQEDDEAFVACTPAGIVELIKRSKIETEGKRAVILGRSLIVGKPVALLMAKKGNPGNCTVTICHSRTRDLATVTREADILVAAIGRAEFVKADMVKPGAAVIDVGINRVEDTSRPRGYRLVGDVAFDEVSEIASQMTPVPGGVGPMTVAMLMRNTVKAYLMATQAIT
jgi:methylenetetrahydrofolate dehydrogenase (NADP+)/methenyltetrahydrofolate cyclohydrolase